MSKVQELYSNSIFQFSENLEKALKLLRQIKTDVEIFHLKEDELDVLFEKVIVHPTEEEKRSKTYLNTIKTLNDLGFQIEAEFKSIPNGHLTKSWPKYTNEKKIFDFENFKDCFEEEVEGHFPTSAFGVGGTHNNSRKLSTKCGKVLVMDMERERPKFIPTTKNCEKVKYPDVKLNEENSLKTLANCDPRVLKYQGFAQQTSENVLNNKKPESVDIQAIRDMMHRTFKTRRPKLVTCHTLEIVKKYPNFSYIDVVKDEFNRINTGHNIRKLERELYRRFDKILEHGQNKSMLLTTALDKYNKDVNNERIKKTAVVMALIANFCSTTEALLKFCPIMDDEPVPNTFLTPKMIIIGDLIGECKIKVYTDNILVLESQDVYDGLLAVYCLYYIFDISYDASVVTLMEYFDFLSGQEQMSVYIDPFPEKKVDVK